MQVIILSNKSIKNFNVEMINSTYEVNLSYTKTKSINCSHNLLGSTDGFSQFQQLFNLDLSHNRISQFFQMASSLIELNLSHNQLGGVFDDFQKSLKSQGTRLYVGSFLSNLKNLKSLDLGYNNISSISSNIFDQNTQLRKINLNNNILSSPLWCFNKLDLIEIIDISYNQLSFSDLKPLEKLRLETLTIKFNPLENTENIEEKLMKYFSSRIRKIELSYTTFDQCYLNNSKQSSKLDGSVLSNDSLQQTERTVASRFSKISQEPLKPKRPKTPQNIQRKNEFQQVNVTPTKIIVRQQRREALKEKNVSITPRKIPLNKTPKKQMKQFELQALCQRDTDTDHKQPSIFNTTPNKDKNMIYTSNQIQKIPQLNLQVLQDTNVNQFLANDSSSEKEDFQMLFEEDQLVDELKRLGELVKSKKQYETSLERQISQNKNITYILKLMIKGVFLDNLDEQNEYFEHLLFDLSKEFEKQIPEIKEIKIKLLRFKSNNSELNQLFDKLEQSEKVVESIKQLI